IPAEYLDELRLHLTTNPSDINFRVKMQPGRGYGAITCLEPRCQRVSFPLRGRRAAEDGGRALGFGSLEAYRRHASNSHHTRSSARGNTLGVTGAPLKSEPSSSSNLSTWDIASAIPSTSVDMASQQTARIKPEPVDVPIPSSASVVKPSRTVKPEPTDLYLSGGHLNQASVSSQSIERQASLRAPLSVNNSASKLEQTSSQPNLDAIRQKLRDLQEKISAKQNALDRLTRKRRLTKGEKTRIINLSAEIAKLQAEKAECHSAIPTVNSDKPPSCLMKRNSNTSVKMESNPVKLEPQPSLSLPMHSLPMQSLPIPPSFQHHSHLRGPIVTPLPQTDTSVSTRKRPLDSDDLEDGEYSGSDEELQWLSDDLEIIRAGRVMEKTGPIIPHLSAMDDGRDSNGDWHGRGRDTFVGPQAKADDIDKFLIEAGNAEQFDGNASIENALEKLGLRSQYDLIPGMEVALMPHQSIGVAWMCEKEQSSFRGGCLGDDMGLGKTVQMIALMVKNFSNDPVCKTNLIIAPTALLDQWKLEIEMKTNCDLKCLVYHGSSKPKRKQDLLKYDIVLTTYTTMALEWPDLEAQERLKLKKKKKPVDDFLASDSDSDDEVVPTGRGSRKQAGLLFQVDFYRVILDEAQAIRNRRTRTSRAVTDLRSTYRWCLTGTPIVNSLVDMYGYIRFLQVRPFYDFKEFQNHIGRLEKKKPDLAVFRLQAVITTFVLRRMKDSMLDGKRLIELPPKTIDLVKLEFSDEEREVYDMVEARSQARFNRYLRAGTVLKNYHQVLVLLLRLRQICSHPALIQEGADAFIDPNDTDHTSARLADELRRAAQLVSTEFVQRMKSKLRTTMLNRIAAEKESADATIDEEECPICFDMMTDAVVTPCTHTFCRECLDELLSAPLPENLPDVHSYKANEKSCPVCRSPICREKLFKLAAFEPTDTELSSKLGNDDEVIELTDTEVEETKIIQDIQESSTKFDVKGKGKARAPRQLRPRKIPRIVDSDDEEYSGRVIKAEDDGEFIDISAGSEGSEEDGGSKASRAKKSTKKSRLRKRRGNVIRDSDDEFEEGVDDNDENAIFGVGRIARPGDKGKGKEVVKFLPSTKMKYMMEQLLKMANERPNEKVIIVSQWTGCLALVSDYLTEASIPHVKYQGDMNRRKRDQAVRVFMSNNQARVMLMSLKCGGVGLNLTRANNVICLDLGWSQAVESQAFDRVHRLGQLHPVHVQRLVIADTVEDRVLAMQERKQILADGSLGEGKGKKIGKLTVRELANLFGLDHRGRVLAKE
ncbi:hypothetical protein AX16_006412, partial [Volvariella volvacea WC 439]